jgi:deoxyribonuclease-4
MRHLGGFVSVAGGLQNGILAGRELDINTIMIHPTPPQRWNTKPFEKESIEKFNSERKNSEIEKVFFHGIYLVNLANPDKQKFHLSKVSLKNYLDLADAVNADSVVFHVGSFKDQEDHEEGYARIAKGINWIFEHSENNKPLALEVAAGAGKVVGSKFEDLARIYEKIENKDRLIFCLDTAHLYSSGYDLVNKLDEVVEEMDKVLGLENIHTVHFNDSKVDFDSKRDRHENLGEGRIGEKAMKAFLNHPKLKKMAFVLETPGMKDADTAKEEIGKLKGWAE